MKRLIIATVSALALGVGGVGLSRAAETSNMNQPSGSYGAATSTSSPSSGGSLPSQGQNAPGQANLSKAQIRQIQERLHAKGLYNGKIDGTVGPDTRRAIAKFQQRSGLPETASLDQRTVNKLLDKGQGSSAGQHHNAPG